MAKNRITITLDDELNEWIYAASKTVNKSQSEIVRICLREFVAYKPLRFSRADKARSKSEQVWRRDA